MLKRVEHSLDMKYFSYVGSYEGAVKLGKQWVRVKNLNLVDKAGWKRHQGPPSPFMIIALNQPIAIDARGLRVCEIKAELFHRHVECCDICEHAQLNHLPHCAEGLRLLKRMEQEQPA